MQPLTIASCDFLPFKIPFLKSVQIAGNPILERSGYYLTLKTTDGLMAQSEVAPLEGISLETVRRTRHDLKDSSLYLKGFTVPATLEELLSLLRQDPHVLNLCGSVRFGVESAIFLLAAQLANQGLAEYLGASLEDVETAVLLQGTYQDVLTQVKKYSSEGAKVFKLKVGDRNLALDVKKVQDIRLILEEGAYLRLDANRQWTFKEACIFAELVGNQKIDFIEEPMNDLTQLDAFYKKTRMRLALDETLSVIRTGIRAPGRCSSPLAEQDGVVAYVLKPMVLGLVPTLGWIEEAAELKRKAIISSAYESPVGFKILAHLACVSGQIAGLGTERFFKGISPIVGEDGIIKKEFLTNSP